MCACLNLDMVLRTLDMLLYSALWYEAHTNVFLKIIVICAIMFFWPTYVCCVGVLYHLKVCQITSVCLLALCYNVIMTCTWIVLVLCSTYECFNAQICACLHIIVLYFVHGVLESRGVCLLAHSFLCFNGFLTSRCVVHAL